MLDGRFTLPKLHGLSARLVTGVFRRLAGGRNAVAAIREDSGASVWQCPETRKATRRSPFAGHCPNLVRSRGLEPPRVSPLPPQGKNLMEIVLARWLDWRQIPSRNSYDFNCIRKLTRLPNRGKGSERFRVRDIVGASEWDQSGTGITCARTHSSDRAESCPVDGERYGRHWIQHRGQKMWAAAQARLNTRWRRVAFVFWLLLVAGGVYFLAVACWSAYDMWRLRAPFIPDCKTLLTKSPFFGDGVKSLAPHTFQDWVNCTNYQAYWAASLEAEMSGREAVRFAIWSLALGFLIFTHRWSNRLHSFWSWINMKTPSS